MLQSPVRLHFAATLLICIPACTPNTEVIGGADKADSGDPATTDSGNDSASDSGTDTGADSGDDTGSDTAIDTGTETGQDSGDLPLAILELSPASFSFDLAFVGQTVFDVLTLGNVGDGPTEVTIGISGVHAAEWVVDAASVELAPGQSSEHFVSVIPENWGDYAVEMTIAGDNLDRNWTIPISLTVQIDADGDGFGSVGSGGQDCDDGEVNAFPGNPEVWYDGIDQDCDGGSDYDRDGDLVAYGVDCDDTDAARYPGNPEIWYDGVDGDCDGANDFDRDGDDSEWEDDCDDTNADAFPEAPEVWYDDVDQDCAGDSDHDQDGDGFETGDDCDDVDPAIYPYAIDTWYDGVDSDCDAADDYDQDADGESFTTDCDDTDATRYSTASDSWYDGIDTNCDGADDYDRDADGESLTTDCDDTDATRYSTASDSWYDGIDTNCDGADDYDQDADGESFTSDCDDTDATRFSAAVDSWYDGIDSNCDRADDYDQDADGESFTTDCDDTDAARSSAAADTWYDGVDSNCDGADDYDQDADGESFTTDCDDTDATRFSAAVDSWYDGVDSNCDGADDFDQDADGESLTTDCDDLDATRFSTATDIWYDGVDSNCDAANDFDQDVDTIDYPDDCDDTDATIGLPTGEIRDDFDNDCNGIVDDLVLNTSATGLVYGISNGWSIGDVGGVSIGGDMDNDGREDLVVVSDELSTGHAWLVSGDNFVGANGLISAYDYADISGSYYEFPLAHAIGPMVDISGDGIDDLLLTGTDQADEGGCAYLFAGGSSLTGNFFAPANDLASFTGDGSYDETRWASAGDVDGDGVYDVIVGAPGDARGGSYGSGGTIAIFAGGSALSGDYDLDDADGVLAGTSADDQLGKSLAIADTDNDGYDDIFSGSPNRNGSGSIYDAGAVFLVKGNATLGWTTKVNTSASFEITGVSREEHLGKEQLPRPADLDDDGDLDLVIGSGKRNSVFVWWSGALSGAVTTADADLVIAGDGAFGYAITTDSDLNGDGIQELVIGAPEFDVDYVEAGAVFVYLGGSVWGSTATTTDADESYVGSYYYEHVGSGLGGGGDVDGDGRHDLAVGASGIQVSGAWLGAVYLVEGW